MRPSARLREERGSSPFREGGRARACLLWPNAYALGMANLGFQQVWTICNAEGGLSTERAFVEGEGAPRSLETGRALADFDLVALALTYEGDLPRAVEALRAAELLPGQRGRRNTLLVAGGAAATANPEPLLAIVDAVFLGEAEGALAAAVDVLPEPVGRFPLGEAGPRGLEGDGKALAALGWILPDGPDASLRRASSFFAASAIVAPGSGFGDAALVELCRGCPRRCRFCLARCLYGRFRLAEPARVLAWAEAMKAHTGRIGLIGAGLADVPDLAGFLGRFRAMGLTCSLSSLRADRMDEALLDELAAHGQRTVTIAPESFSPRDLELLGKGLDPDRVAAGLERLLRAGFARVKCYLMMGLPGQEDEDVTAVFDRLETLAPRLSTVTRLTLSWSILLPRPHTAMEGEALADKAAVRRQIKAIRRRAARLRGLAVDLQLPSFAEARRADALARGDRITGEQLLRGEAPHPPAPAARPWRRVRFHDES